MIDLSPHFATLASLSGLVVMITGWLNTHGLKLSGWKAQGLSWVISLAIAFLGAWKDVGIFAETDILWTVINGLAVGLLANGIYSVEFIKTVLEFVKAKPSSAPKA
jgi:hypothetical protein